MTFFFALLRTQRKMIVTNAIDNFIYDYVFKQRLIQINSDNKSLINKSQIDIPPCSYF